jgi:glycerol uptake facilitator-like aquaporin
MFGRRKSAAIVAEFLGTGILTILILTVQRSTIGVPFFVAAAAGLTVAVLMFIFGDVSGAHNNPALTIGAVAVGRLKVLVGVVYLVAQFLGAYLSFFLFSYFVKTPVLRVSDHYNTRILVAEAVGAFVLAFGWAAGAYSTASKAAKAAFTGLAYMVGIVIASNATLALTNATYASLPFSFANPAVALGIRMWVWGTHFAGPIIGAIIGIALYHYMFAPSVAIAELAAATVSETTIINEEIIVEAKPTRAASTRKPRATRTTAAKPRATTARRKTSATTRKTTGTRRAANSRTTR